MRQSPLPAAQVFSQMRYARSGDPRRWLIRRTLATQMASIPLFAGSIALLCGNPDGLYVMVPGFLLLSLAFPDYHALVSLSSIRKPSRRATPPVDSR